MRSLTYLNVKALLILVPLEMATKVLYRVGDALLPVDSSGVTYRWEGFVRFGVQSLTRKLIIPNEVSILYDFLCSQLTKQLKLLL